MTRDIMGRPYVYRYPTIAKMPDVVLEFYLRSECECLPDLPDGRCHELCMPCKARQDMARWQRDLMHAIDYIGRDEIDIPFRF